MPLVVAKLSKSLQDVFNSEPSNGIIAAQKLAQAYQDYANSAMAPPGKPIFTGAEVLALSGALAGALSDPLTGSAAKIANGWMTGLNAFWLAPPVPFVGGPASGVSTVITGIGSVVPSLTAIFSNIKNTTAMAAQQIATVLDTVTKTVLVTYATPTTPSPPPPALLL